MKYYEVDFHIRCSEYTTDCNTVHDGNMTVQNVREIITAIAGANGFETFEDTDNGIKGYVQTSLFDRQTLENDIDNLPFEGIGIDFYVNETEDKDWNEVWENEGFEPIEVDDRCVIHDGRHVPEGKEYDISVEIDARMAFGTGTHETTRMVISTMLGMDLHGKVVLDCGCGTGILGIVALKCGAESAIGYDIDEWSTDNSYHNAIINNVEERYRALNGDASVLREMDSKFDIVVANINRNILLEDMPKFHEVMKNGAVLVLSGFYTEDIDVLKRKAESIGLQLISSKADNNWACIAFQ